MKSANATRPSWQEVCPETEGNLAPAWIVVDSTARWMCAGGIAAWPVDQSWNKDGFGATAAVDGYQYDVLPYGKSLRLGDITCSMAETGVTCSNKSTGAGFTLNKAGVTFTG